mmetsp:Transcript_2519/g.7533  ORF Transcript_2519/g.7533 Transcript_2519/m.7533 type:complete len:864 (+) Transcript_2519:110-2701(+)
MSGVGIDFGNANCVVALARRGGIDVAANEVSNRATPCMVAFQGEARHIGEAAANFAMQNFKNTCTDLSSLLGVKLNSPEGERLTSWVKNKIVEGPDGFVSAQCVYGKEFQPHVFTYEALAGALLSKLMHIASTENGAPLSECVVSVPGYFSDLQRRAMLDAARIGNVNLLRILNEHAAIALTYGIFRTAELPEEKPLKVAFVDVGQHKTTVCIANFLKSGVKIVSVAHDEALGGRDWDELLVQHFAAEFKEKYKIDVLSEARPTLRLRKDCEKLKKVLSANAEAPINIECLMNDIDVRGHMKRDEYEAMMKPLLDRLEAVCKQAISGAGVTDLKDINAVEIVGGGSRVKAVKQAVSEVFGQTLKTTLNADEAIARGCALMCAMLSPTVRVREYALTDAASYTLSVIRSTEGNTQEGDDVVLVEKFAPTPCMKALSLKNVGKCTLTLKKDREVPVSDYVVEAPTPEEADNTKMRAKIKVNNNGIASVFSAALLVEEEVEIPVNEPEKSGVANNAAVKEDSKGKESTAEVPKKEDEKMDTTQTDEKPAEDVEMKKTEEAPKMKKVKKTKTVDLVVKRGTVNLGLSEEAVQAAVDEEAEMKATDLYLKERSDALNSLESYVYDSRSRLDDYGELKDYAPQEVRQGILQQLEEAENWIYSEEAEEAAKSTFLQKRQDLADKIVPIQKRKLEFEERPIFAERLKDLCIKYKEIIGGDAKYEHITDDEKQTVVKACEETLIWLQKEMSAQNTMPKDSDPKLTTALIDKKKQELTNTCLPIVEKPKPAPPKVEEPANKKEDANMDTKDAPAADAANTPKDADMADDAAKADDKAAAPMETTSDDAAQATGEKGKDVPMENGGSEQQTSAQ